MSTSTGSTIPNTVSTTGSSSSGNTNSNNGRNNNGNRNGRGGKGNNSNNGIAGNNGNTVPKEFKNDSTDLGVMYQKYFDCNTQQDKVRFVMTQEDMALYVAQQYKQFGNDLKALVLDPSKPLPTVTRPSMPLIPDPNNPNQMMQKKLDDCDDMEKIIYTETAKDYVKRLKALEADLQALYNFILGRCTERLHNRLKTHERYDVVDTGSDPAGLLLMIREISHQVESNVKLARTIDDHVANIYKTKQGPNVTIAQYHTHFKSAVAALQTMGGPEERNRVLEYLMFLKEKRCGKIKGRGCADGRKQRLWTSKHDASSPTAFLESLFLTSMVDARERRKVVTIDIPGAFLHNSRNESLNLSKLSPRGFERMRATCRT